MTTASFYLTPDLKSKLVNLAIFVNGKYEPFVNQVSFIEQDPSQCKYLFCSGYFSRRYLIYLFLQSETTFRRNWAIQFYERLPNSSTSSSSN